MGLIGIIIISLTSIILFILVASFFFEVKGHPKSIKLIDKENNLKIAKDFLLKDINAAEVLLHISLNRYYHPLFNDDSIKEAFKEARKRGVRIVVITGEIEDMHNEMNVLRQLNAENVICLYIKKDFPLQSYRIIDSVSLHLEKGNFEKGEKTVYSRYENNRFKSLDYEKKFKSLLENIK